MLTLPNSDGRNKFLSFDYEYEQEHEQEPLLPLALTLASSAKGY
jgi:hypothetical protein